MAREPGYGELLGRLDDVEEQVDGLRKALAVVIVLGLVFWAETVLSKGGKADG